MKLLLAYCSHAQGVDDWYASIATAAPQDIDVKCFCVTIDPPGPRLTWLQLDELWRKRDPKLLDLYARLHEAAEQCDVLLNYNGANLHPEFLKHLPTYNVYSCFDDPESSWTLSEPVAATYDAAFYGNIASRFQYEHWGCMNIAWLPVFTAPNDVPSPADAARVLTHHRDVNIAFIGGTTHWRKHRLAALQKAFPDALIYGRGWADGFLSDKELHDLYLRTKIGWNIHNSTGPVNRRLFTLAGYGILPLCDNRTGLGQIFKLGEEVIGFDTIPEAIEATSYYLNNDEERKQIAVAAYRRYWQDYCAEAIWKLIGTQIEAWMAESASRETSPLQVVRSAPRTTSKISQRFLAAKKRAGRTVNRIRRGVSAAQVPVTPSQVRVFDERAYLGEKVIPYQENIEQKGVNLAQERLENDLPLDWPNILALNWAVTSLIGDATQIVEIGSGTGPFAEYASVDQQRWIDCFEQDDFARDAAIRYRSRPNVRYYKSYEGNLSSEYDLLVSVEVIEHVDNLDDFLRFCSQLAPRALFTTPNRNAFHSEGHAGPPRYRAHVREYAPGEIYWLLKQFYNDVYLYYLPDVYVPWLQPMTIADDGTPIIAECINPFEQQRSVKPGRIR